MVKRLPGIIRALDLIIAGQGDNELALKYEESFDESEKSADVLSAQVLPPSGGFFVCFSPDLSVWFQWLPGSSG